MSRISVVMRRVIGFLVLSVALLGPCGILSPYLGLGGTISKTGGPGYNLLADGTLPPPPPVPLPPQKPLQS